MSTPTRALHERTGIRGKDHRRSQGTTIISNVRNAQAPTSGTVGAWEQQPYRAPRLGSGVLCSGKTIVSGEEYECESPLTTRLRGGIDTLERPVAEYLCETCGSVFVAITVSLDPLLVRFDEVDVKGADDGVEVLGIGGALRRGERTVKARAKAKAGLLTCPWCKEDVVGVEALDEHVIGHAVPT